jgi:PST family polysaccharide transporter
MLGLLASATEVGYYSAAMRLTNMAVAVTNIPLAQALFPFIGKAFGESRTKGIETVQRISPIILLVTSATTVFIFLLGPIALRILYGSAFNPSAEVFRILAFIPFMVGLHNLFGIQIMLNLKMDKFYFLILFLGAIFGLLLNYMMIHVMGFVGTAWNYLIMEIYISFSSYLVLRKSDINPFDRKQFSLTAIKEHLRPFYGKYIK